MKRYGFCFIIILVSLSFPQMALSAEFKDINVEQARKGIEAARYDLILDVRTPREYTGPLGHIKGGKLIPVQELSQRIGEIVSFKNKRVLVYCKTGGRSSIASGILTGNGFSSVENMDGGMVGWNKKGYPVEE